MKGVAGKQIRTFWELEAAAHEKKSVCLPNVRGWSHRAHPAAFMIQQPAIVLMNLIRAGMFIYHKRRLP